jgi:hypothetical protein
MDYENIEPWWVGLSDDEIEKQRQIDLAEAAYYEDESIPTPLENIGHTDEF